MAIEQTPSTESRGGRRRRYQAAGVVLSLIVMLGAGLVFLTRGNSVASLLNHLESQVNSVGAAGPVVFGLIYVLAVVAMVPASGLTLLAGGLFPYGIAVLTVTLAANAGAAICFLLARFCLREVLARRLLVRPKLLAIDRAVSRDGWKIVALSRLSPVVPFNVQNYLYGLTGITFTAHGLSTLVAMFPGTLLYTYLGRVGRASLESASGARPRSPLEWLALGVGLAATLVVSILVTRLARRALREVDQSAETAPVGMERNRPEAELAPGFDPPRAGD